MQQLEELAAWARVREGSVITYRYGAHEEQAADLRLPEGDGPCPIAIILHGGLWRARFGRETTAAVAVALTDRGWVTWNVEYRRVGCGGGVPETLDDVLGATTAVMAIEDALLDRSRIVAVGHSTGVQLALWLAGAGKVTAVVGLSGVCDLTYAAEQGLGDGAAIEFAGGRPEDRPQVYTEADPMRRIPIGVPQLLIHGRADGRVPSENSRRYQEAAAREGDDCELLELDDVDHFDLIDPRSDAWEVAAAAVDRAANLTPSIASDAPVNEHA